MLSLFKSNNPGVVVFYVFYILLFRACFFFMPANTHFIDQHTEPLSGLLFSFLKSLPFRYEILSLILSSLLCFAQALLINGMVNRNKILPRKNYAAGAIFIIIASFFKESLVFSPASVALTFIIISTSRIFSLIKKEKAHGDVFDVGFFISMATLFYFPAIILIIPAYIGLATMRSFSYREWLIVLIGFTVPFLLVFTYYYWTDTLSYLPLQIAGISGMGWLRGIAPGAADWLMISSIALLSAVCMVFLPGALYSSLIQVRKFSNFLVLMVFVICIGFLLQQTVSLSHFILLSLPISVIASLILIRIKRALIFEVIHIILILLVLAGQFLPLLNVL